MIGETDTSPEVATLQSLRAPRWVPPQQTTPTVARRDCRCAPVTAERRARRMLHVRPAPGRPAAVAPGALYGIRAGPRGRVAGQLKHARRPECALLNPRSRWRSTASCAQPARHPGHPDRRGLLRAPRFQWPGKPRHGRAPIAPPLSPEEGGCDFNGRRRRSTRNNTASKPVNQTRTGAALGKKQNRRPARSARRLRLGVSDVPAAQCQSCLNG